MEELCGARLTYNYMRIGGVSFDIPQQFYSKNQSVFTGVCHFFWMSSIVCSVKIPFYSAGGRI
ncbi:MAG: hypothetical protein R3A45_02430 [Bdellovibrionota bacterium]